MSSQPIPFNRAYVTGSEFPYIQQAIANGHLSGNGPFSVRCNAWLSEHTATSRTLLTHSATGALEMAAILADLKPGDEVIMPSFAFVSAANAVALRGATPVFVEIRSDTLNLDESLVEDAITGRTRAILPIHYAGVACELDTLLEIARRHGLLVIEDAAQALFSTYRGRPLGGIGDLAAVSFHETKNVTCGEGGALLVRDPDLVERAEIVQEKGTDRSRFFRGQTDKYTWVDVGSSFLMSEINAAFLWAQLEHAAEITAARHRIWSMYHEAFAALETMGVAQRPVVPEGCEHNAHLYYLLLRTEAERTALLRSLAAADISAVFHFVPLHDSKGGRQFGRPHGDLSLTTELSERLIRLPLWPDMTDEQVNRVIEGVRAGLAVTADAHLRASLGAELARGNHGS